MPSRDNSFTFRNTHPSFFIMPPACGPEDGSRWTHSPTRAFLALDASAAACAVCNLCNAADINKC
jgi:hypothetical protein